MGLTYRQQKLLEKYELALANIAFNGKIELAEKWAPIVEALQAGYFVWAVILADNAAFPAHIINRMRKDFDVGRIE